MPRIPRPTDHTTVPRRHHWSDDALCAGLGTDLFYPAGKNGVCLAADVAAAKRICVRCPVRPECLAHALAYPEKYGVWGGLSEDERRGLLSEARQAAEKRRRERANASTAR